MASSARASSIVCACVRASLRVKERESITRIFSKMIHYFFLKISIFLYRLKLLLSSSFFTFAALSWHDSKHQEVWREYQMKTWQGSGVCVALSLCVALWHSGCVEHLWRALWPCPSINHQTRHSVAATGKRHRWPLQPRRTGANKQEKHLVLKMFGLGNIAIFLPTAHVNATITVEFYAELFGESLVQVYKTTFYRSSWITVHFLKVRMRSL